MDLVRVTGFQSRFLLLVNGFSFVSLNPDGELPHPAMLQSVEPPSGRVLLEYVDALLRGHPSYTLPDKMHKCRE